MRELMLRLAAVAAMVLALMGAAQAGQTVVMTPTTVNAALAALRPGDTLRMEGVFSNGLLIRNRDFGGVTVDASAATLEAGIRLVRVHNIAFVGGQWQAPGKGDAIRVEDSSHVSISGATVLGSDGRLGGGVRLVRSGFVTVRDTLFDGLRNSVILATVTDSLITANRFQNGGEDGIKILDSQRIIASHNSCTGFVPIAGYHPDCIQLWSIVDRPPQSDVYLLNNLAIGLQQGFVSFDPAQFSGTRLTFAGNYVATTTGHTITCLGCTESRFEDNVVVTLPEARWLAPLRVTGPGTGNMFDNNLYVDLRGQFGASLPERIFSSLMPSIAGLVGSSWADRSHMLALPDPRAVNGVPEPARWAMLLTGFGLVGGRLRRRGQRSAVLA